MNFQVIMVLAVLLIATTGFLFSGLNRFRKINENIFIQKTKYRYSIQKNDNLDVNRYKRFSAIINIITALFFLLLLIIMYMYVKDITVYTDSDFEYIATMANGAALVFLCRINIADLLSEKYITRHNNEKKQHYKIGYLVLNTAVLVAFVYNVVSL